MKNFIIIGLLLCTTCNVFGQGVEKYVKNVNVSNSNHVELTDASGNSLNLKSTFKIQLVTRGTATKTGAEYIVSSINSLWQARAVSLNGDVSNHPLIVIENNVVKIKTNHVNNYPVRAFVTELVSDEADVFPSIFGSSYQWQRYKNNLTYPDGNVGIGVESPEHKLDVWLSAVASTRFKTYNYGAEVTVNTTGGWARSLRFINKNDSKAVAFGGHSGNAYISTGFDVEPDPTGYRGQNFTFTSNGNLGVGTRSPSSKLEIRAQPVLSESFIKLKTSDSQDKDFFEIKNSTGVAGQFIPGIIGRHTSDNRQALYLNAYINEDNDLGTKPLMTFDSRIDGSPVVNRPLFSWDSFGNTKMTLSADGDLGIGTIETGTHKLAVEGSIGAREIKVEGSGWSDFVFEKDYKLPTLEEVEEHIQENGHLQDIPNAAEVAENGIFLGEMDSKLLQKIEELMLYTIEQQKQIELLKLDNQKFKKELQELTK